MSMFDDVVNKTKEIASAAGKKTEEVLKLAKLRLALSETTSKLEKAYAAMGRSVYTAKKENAEAMPDLTHQLESIDALLVKQEEIVDKMAQLRNCKKCAACGEENPETALYCQKCGEKF